MIDTGLQKALTDALLAIQPLGITNDDNGRAIIAAVTAGVVAAYEAGGLAALAITPWDCQEITYRGTVTVDKLQPLLDQGWEPWMLTSVMLPPDARKRGVQQSEPGWLVRFKRRRLPTADQAEIASILDTHPAPGADSEPRHQHCDECGRTVSEPADHNPGCSKGLTS